MNNAIRYGAMLEYYSTVRENMVVIDVLIFDLDGTLVDSREDITDAVNFTLGALKFRQKNPEEIISYMGTGVKDLIRKSLGKKDESSIDNAVNIFESYFKKHSADKSLLYLHVKEILEYFRYKDMFIITNRSKDMSALTLRKLGIDKYFKEIIGADDEYCIKPSACPINKIMASRIKDKTKTMIIGDMDLDVLSGKEAGIMTCAVTYGIGDRISIEKSNPDFIIDDILKLKEIIR